MSLVRLGLCCSRPEGLRLTARSSFENAVRFFRVSGSEVDAGRLSLARLDWSAATIERSLEEALESDVTHVLFLAPGAILPFYSLQSLLEMGVDAVSGISWTWRTGRPDRPPEIFPRIGYFDGEGRPYPYFGWSAPDIFEVDWCGLDCLLLRRKAIERILDPLDRLDGPTHLRMSQALRSRRIPILIDSFIQCPQAVARADGSRKLLPSPKTWLEFSRDYPARRIPRGPVYDPAYRGRAWYREWVARCAE